MGGSSPSEEFRIDSGILATASCVFVDVFASVSCVLVPVLSALVFSQEPRLLRDSCASMGSSGRTGRQLEVGYTYQVIRYTTFGVETVEEPL